VPDPVGADLLGADPGQVPTEAAPQVVIPVVGDWAPAGVPQQLTSCQVSTGSTDFIEGLVIPTGRDRGR